MLIFVDQRRSDVLVESDVYFHFAPSTFEKEAKNSFMHHIIDHRMNSLVHRIYLFVK